MTNIENAFLRLKQDLHEYLKCDDYSQYPVKKLSYMLGPKVKININQAKNEVLALKKTFEFENKKDQLIVNNTYDKF